MPPDVRDDDISATSSEQAGPAATWQRIAFRVARFVVAAAVLTYLFTRIPVAQVLAVLRRPDITWVLLAVLLSLLVQLGAAVRMKLLADAHRLELNLFEIFKVNLVTRFYGLALPGGSFTATAIRVFKLTNIHRHYAGAIAAVSLDRSMATLTMCVCGMICWLLARAAQPGWFWLMAGVTLGLLISFFWLYYKPAHNVAADSISGRWFGHRFKSIELAVSEARALSSRNLARVLQWSVLAHLVGIAEYVALAQALDLQIDVLAIGWIRTAMLMATLVPITPSGLGLREGAALLALQMYGVSPEVALAYSLLVFAVSNVAIGLIGGALEMIGRKQR